MDPEPRGKPSNADTMRTIGALSTVGISFVLAILLGVWFGRLLDNWLGTSPWFFFIMLGCGFVAGALNVYRTATRFIK